jgi:DNA-binding PadR family transcriptional regulator
LRHLSRGRSANGGHDHEGRFRRFARGVGERFGRDHGPDEGRGHGHEHGRGRHRGGLGRFFEQGDLRLVILGLIAEKPRHGYEIIKAIEERAAGAYSPSPGVIYPTLTLLEEQGLIRPAASEGTKRQFEITGEGTAFLEANRRTVDALFAKLGGISAGEGGGFAPQIVRARENLKLALRMRLGRGPLSEEQITALAAALDLAATTIERI